MKTHPAHNGEPDNLYHNLMPVDPPLAVSVAEVCRLTSLGRTSVFALLRAGRLERRTINGRTVVLMRSILKLLDLEFINEREG